MKRYKASTLRLNYSLLERRYRTTSKVSLCPTVSFFNADLYTELIALMHFLMPEKCTLILFGMYNS